MIWINFSERRTARSIKALAPRRPLTCLLPAAAWIMAGCQTTPQGNETLQQPSASEEAPRQLTIFDTFGQSDGLHPGRLGRLVIWPFPPTQPIRLPHDLMRLLSAVQGSRAPQDGSCSWFEVNRSDDPKAASQEPRGVKGRVSGRVVGSDEAPSAPLFVFRTPMASLDTSDAAPERPLGWVQPDRTGRFQCDGLPEGFSLGYSQEFRLNRLLAKTDPQALGEVVFEGPPTGRLRIVTGLTRDTPLLLRLAVNTPAPEGMTTKSLADAEWAWTTPPRLSLSPGFGPSSWLRPTALLKAREVVLELPAASYSAALVHPQSQQICLFAGPVVANESHEFVCPTDFAQNVSQKSQQLLAWPVDDDLPSGGLDGEPQFNGLRNSGLDLAAFGRRDGSVYVSLTGSSLGDAAVGNSSAGSGAAQRQQRPWWPQEEPILLDGSHTMLPTAWNASDAIIENAIAQYLADRATPAHVAGQNLLRTRPSPQDAPDQGATPKSVALFQQTRIKTPRNTVPSSENMITEISNGVTFHWKTSEPRSALAPAPTDGLIAFTVRIPAFNHTEYVEIHINGQLWRRHVVNRGDYRSPLDVPIEETIESSNDFVLGVYAWGRAFLPEFVFGLSRLRPRAILSKICFDVNKNGLCDDS